MRSECRRATPLLKSAASVALASGMLVSASGCGEIVTTVTPQSDCTLTTHLFHRSKGRPTDMGAKATSQCDTMVTEMRIWVDLQRYSNGTWVTVLDDDDPAIYYNVRGFTGKVGQSFMQCTSGTYRGISHASYLYRGTWYRSPQHAGPAATDPCD